MEGYSPGGFELKEDGDVPLRVFVDAYKTVNSYNRSIKNPVFANSKEGESAESIGDKFIKQAMRSVSYDDIREKYDKSMEAIGIELIPQGESHHEPAVVSMQIGRFAPKFTEYLHSSVKSENLISNKELTLLLRDMIQQVDDQITTSGLSGTEHANLIDRTAGLEDLIAEYKRIDPDGQFQLLDKAIALEKLVRWQRANTLHEHLLFEKWNLDVPIENWQNISGPWSWHSEARTEREVSLLWKDVISVLKKLKPVKNLFDRALQQLQSANKMARLDISRQLQSKITRSREERLNRELKMLEDAYITLRNIEFEVED